MKQGLMGLTIILATLLLGQDALQAEDSEAGIAEGGCVELSEKERLAIVLEHSHEPEFTMKMPAVIRFEQEGSGIQYLRDDRVSGSRALAIAATCYAASTLDFDVTMHDLMDGGFWPWDWYPEGIDPELPFGNFGISGTDISGREYLEWIVLNHDDPSWVMDARYKILRASYELLYRERMVDNIAVLTRLPQFWYNELEDRPMQESDADGDYSMVDPMPYQLFYGTNQSQDPEGRTFPLLNYIFLPGPYTTNIQTNSSYDSQYRVQRHRQQQEQSAEDGG